MAQNLFDERREMIEVEAEEKPNVLVGSQILRGRIKLYPSQLSEVYLDPCMSLVGSDLVKVQDLLARVGKESYGDSCRNTQASGHEGHGKGKIGAVALSALEQKVFQLVPFLRQPRPEGVEIVILKVALQSPRLTEVGPLPGCNLLGELSDLFVVSVVRVEPLEIRLHDRE